MQVKQGRTIDLYPLAATSTPGRGMGRWGQEFPEALAILGNSIQAAAVLLMVLTKRGLDRRLLGDELIEAALGLMKHHLERHVAPCLDPELAAKLATAGAAGGGVGGGGGGGGGEREVEGEVEGEGDGQGERGTGEGGRSAPNSKEERAALDARLRGVSKSLMGGLGKVYEVVGLLEALVSRVRLEDRFLLPLCSMCGETLTLEAGGGGGIGSWLPPLHRCALGVLQAISRRYPEHRALIVEDLFGLLLKMPSGKRSLRTFAIRNIPETIGGGGTDGVIQNSTALIMLLVQACTTHPRSHSPNPNPGDSGSDNGRGGFVKGIGGGRQRQQQSGLGPGRGLCSYYASRFLARCLLGSKDEGGSFQSLLANTIDDLLACLILPEWPAAEMLLHALCHALIKDLREHKGGGGGRDSQFCLVALDILGRVGAGLADITRQEREREAPMVLPKAVEARGDGAPQDEGERVECLCGDGDDGRLMLDCDRCHRWFHGECVGINSEE
ncbi:unnamed protein product, partial [Discosporangium mesarthrocarpum]